VEDNRIPLNVITLSEHLENLMRISLIKDSEETKISLEPNILKSLIDELKQKLTWCKSEGFHNIPLICRPDIRLYVRRLLERDFPRLRVISYLEITPQYKLEVLATINI
jgi:flagellar biosynthesis protein FlhA